LLCVSYAGAGEKGKAESMVKSALETLACPESLAFAFSYGLTLSLAADNPAFFEPWILLNYNHTFVCFLSVN